MREDDFFQHPVAIERCPVCGTNTEDHMSPSGLVAATICAVVVLFALAGIIIWLACFR